VLVATVLSLSKASSPDRLYALPFVAVPAFPILRGIGQTGAYPFAQSSTAPAVLDGSPPQSDPKFQDFQRRADSAQQVQLPE